jgi:hypothetical protein
MDELVFMLFEGDMVDYMVKANPEKYGPYVHTTKRGKKILYVQLMKALYGSLGKICRPFLSARFDDKTFQVLLSHRLQNEHALARWGVVNASARSLDYS